MEHAVDTLDIRRQHHALVAIALGGLEDEFGVTDGAGVDADLIRPAFEHPVKIVERIDAPAHSEGDKDGAGHLGQHIGEEFSPLGGSGNVIEHELVGSVV